MSLRLPETTYRRIQYFAQQDGIAARAWINQALKSSVNGWREADEDGNYMRRKGREKKIDQQEAATEESGPVEKPVYTTETAVLGAYREHAGPEPEKGYLKWMEKYEEFRDEFFRP